MPNPFTQPGDWLRGNLHAHTTDSDGALSPQATIAAYAHLGYDFLALTDHDHLSAPAELDWQGMTGIRGAEVCWELPGGLSGLHVVALGLDALPVLPAGTEPPAAMAALCAQATLCFIGHPSWCLNDAADLLPLEGFIGVEVFNRVCEALSNRGHSEPQWDVLLLHGRPVWGLAVDDCHDPLDIGHGWIMVKSQERTEAALLQAVRDGNFYASRGPELHGLARDDDHLRIHCSPCVEAAVLGAAAGSGFTSWRLPELPRPFEEILLPLPPQDAWLRVEVMDVHGHKAWSNPFRVPELG
jgi:hypothetical protein